MLPYAYRLANQKRVLLQSFEGDYSLLMIPKIAFTKPFFLTDIEKNNLDTGIMAMSDKDILLLASHSGNGIHSYFKNLEKLGVGDEFYIWNDNKDNKYQIIEKNYKAKDGKLFYKSNEKDLVIFITCSKIAKDKQVYFIGKRL